MHVMLLFPMTDKTKSRSGSLKGNKSMTDEMTFPESQLKIKFWG